MKEVEKKYRKYVWECKEDYFFIIINHRLIYKRNFFRKVI